MTSKKEMRAKQAADAVFIRQALVPHCAEQGLGIIHSNAEKDGSHLVQVNDLKINVLETGEVQLNGERQKDAAAAVEAVKQKTGNAPRM